jgi:hypothetical protein
MRGTTARSQHTKHNSASGQAATIYHVALPANNPQSTARTLAEILGGEAMPFPVIPGAWMAWSADGASEIEVTPRGLGFKRANPGSVPEVVSTAQDRGATGWHLAVGTSVDAAEVVRIAERAGWPAQICDRKGLFEVVEVWVDDTCLIEVLDPGMQTCYRAAFTPRKWKLALQQIETTAA